MKKRLVSSIMAVVLMMSMILGMASAVEVATTTVYKYSGTKEITLDGDGNQDTSCVQVQDTSTWGNMEFSADDVLYGTITPKASATNGYIPAINGFNSSWGGWQAAQGSWVNAGENGSITATVQDIMDANSITSIDDFGGLIFQIWGTTGDSFDWTFEIQQAGTVEMEPNQTYVQTTEDGSAARFVMLISEELAENSSEVSFEISNGTSSVTKTSTYCYDSISAAGAKLTAPEGYVFVAYAVTGIPSGVSLTCEITVE